jgi:protein-S-isoprenylcysteine O-methyltransferase Ste14
MNLAEVVMCAHPETIRMAVMDASTRRGVRIWIVKNALAVVIVGASIFWAAGRVEWIWGWVFEALLVVNFVAMVALFIPRRPELLAERSGLQQGTKKWDLVLAPLTAYGTVVTAIVAALDVRFAWSAGFGVGVHLLGFALVAASFAVVLLAMLSNPFFAATVRIQTERGHNVANAGPYRFVRHPGYAGILLFHAGMPALLGSAWAYIATSGGILALIVRTALEDGTLRRELPGYPEYMARVRYRLIPRIW